MPPHPARPYLTSLDKIIVSNSEHCSIECFIDQYVKTRGVQSDAELRNDVIETLRRFSCTAPVMLFELNAWLDSCLGLKALHPDYLQIIDEFGDFPRHPESRQQATRTAL